MKLKIAFVATSTLLFSIAFADNVAIIDGKKYTCKDGASFVINKGVALCDGKVIQPDKTSEEIAASVIDEALQQKPAPVKKKSKKKDQPIPRLDAETLRKKTFQAVNKTVSAEEFPQKCIIKYSITSNESTRRGATPQELTAIAKNGKAEGLSPAEIVAKIEAASKTPSTTQQLTATLLYKSGGVIKKDVILDLQTSVEDASDLLFNMKDVMTSYNDRYCKEFRTETESESENSVPNSNEKQSQQGIQ